LFVPSTPRFRLPWRNRQNKQKTAQKTFRAVSFYQSGNALDVAT